MGGRHRQRRRPVAPLRVLAVGSAMGALGATAAMPVASRAQPTVAVRAEPPIVSLGQPPRWMPYVSGTALLRRPDAERGASALLGVYRPLGNPVAGLFGAGAEAYGTAGGHATGGLRLLAVSRAINLAAGLDWDARARTTVPIVSWTTASRRGGLFGDGSTLRVDWLPARGHTLGFGITVPLAQPLAGRTRRGATGVTLPPRVPVDDDAGVRLPPATDSALAAVDEAVTLIRIYTNFFGDGDESSLRASVLDFRRTVERVRDSLVAPSPHFAGGRDYATVQRAYPAALARAFGAAARGSASGGPRSDDPSLGATIAARARAGLLDDVLLPYNALFGQVKNRQHDIGGFTTRTRVRFARWLDDSSAVPAARRAAVRAAHARWIAAVEREHRALVERWDDSRRIWLPLQLALTPDQHDEQAEVDALVARAADGAFTGGNALTYLSSFDLPIEFARGVLAARDYHVLWIHDFAGRAPGGGVDQIGFREVADAYLPALTAAVQRYDGNGHLPAYFVFLDQYFYEETNGRRWMTILADPLAADVQLPNKKMEAHLRMRQQELRAAVSNSRALQGAAAARGGTRWLRDVVRVHVSVTQPSDFTFRSHRIIPPLPFLPDNLMRDHRKLAFYDLTEAAPERGALVVAGVGIGEHYATPTWEDRGLLVRGPAAVEARAAARRLLRRNGIAERELPAALRAVPPAVATTSGGAPAGPTPSGPAPSPGVPTAGALLADAPPAARVLQVHNEPGFGPKRSSVARAMLYGLAPRGSILVVPDPLWLDGNWAGMVAGAALRGARVHVIAPSRANSPNEQAPVLSRAHDILVRLLEIQQGLGPQIRAAGGDLRVGIYAAEEDVNDVAAQARAVRAGLARSPWLRTLVPFDSATVHVLDTVPRLLAANGYEAVAVVRDASPRPPQLHLKTQLLADSSALAALVAHPEWPNVLRRTLLERARRTAAPPDLRLNQIARLGPVRTQPRDALLTSFARSRPPGEQGRVSFYFTLGTQNHDPRGMMMDGEASLVVSGPMAAVGLVDSWFLMARSTWVTTQDELDRYLPPHDNWVRRLARYIRFVL